jgi:hypothetical protein
LAIGFNFDGRLGENRQLQKLNTVFSVGAKLKSKNQFATISKNGEFQKDNIGITLKASFIGNGWIVWSKRVVEARKGGETINGIFYEEGQKVETANMANAVKAFRKKPDDWNSSAGILDNKDSELYLYNKYKKLAKNYNNDSIDVLKAEIYRLENTWGTEKELEKILLRKEAELYEKMAKEEIEFIEKNKLYKFVSDKWLSIDAYLPLGEIEYKIAENASSIVNDKRFYPFEFTLSGTYFRQYSNGISLFATMASKLKNNNNILAEGLQTVPFQTTTVGANNILVVTNSDDVYLTRFDDFVTPSFSVEIALFFLNTIGISPSIEQNIGEYDALNWKLGIPVSLKDKDGKPKVNFELLWKEEKTLTSSNHFVGISTNFIFGSLIN